MTPQILVNCCAVILLTIILNRVRAHRLEDDLEKITTNGGAIDGIFKPLEKLGYGYTGVTYRGQFFPYDNMEIAMKFAWTEREGKGEYEMYSYLSAIDNPNVLANGIPSILYFGTWNNHTMMGMTLHDTKFMNDIYAGTIEELDLLIIFREFVKIIKYIHSKGIKHHDCTFKNMAILNGQGIIFDFGISKDMAGCDRRKKLQIAKNDFEIFLNGMFSIMLYNLPNSTWHWIGLSPNDRQCLLPQNWPALTTKLAEQAENEFSGLRRVSVEFAKHAADKKSTKVIDTNGQLISFYDQLYQVICEECEKYGCKATASVPISSIPDPFEVEQYDRSNVNYKLFEHRYAERMQRARMARSKM